MRTLFIYYSIPLLLLACTTSEQRQHNQVMDAVEARLKLPHGAGKLSEYARHYALDERGLVVGVYSPGYRAPSPNETCEELLEDMTTRTVPCEEPPGDRLPAGQRQWVGDTSKLPGISDGGCSVITVIYDPNAGIVKSANCNGVA